ncbi:hypothetical protein N9K77_00290 [bacterium]|nr:hypothetical protein [bacterium]
MDLVDVLDFSKVELYFNKTKLTFIDDFYPYGNPTNNNYKNTQIVNVGYGIKTKERNDYLGKNTKGKVVFIKQGLPTNDIIDKKEGNWRRKVVITSLVITLVFGGRLIKFLHDIQENVRQVFSRSYIAKNTIVAFN